jgi:hypothetical protein
MEMIPSGLQHAQFDHGRMSCDCKETDDDHQRSQNEKPQT